MPDSSDNVNFGALASGTVDWSRPIEAVHEDGRVVPVDRIGGDGQCVKPDLDGGWFSFKEDGTHLVKICPWRIRNVQPTTPELDPALWDRMVALVRDIARTPQGTSIDLLALIDARAIVADLPKPVDPDLIEAREIAASMLEVAQGGTHIEETRRGERDGYVHVCIALAGIQRGRELATPEVSHVG